MNIPANRYSLESFLDYIAQNKDEVFSKQENRKWLKAHVVYSIKQWRTIFEGLQLREYGDITFIAFKSELGETIDQPLSANFYIYEWEPGLLVIFTSSTKEDYERTLKEFIISKRGLMQSWIAPWLLDHIKNYLLDTYQAKIYRFIGRRYRHWRFPSRIRPEYDRRHSYSGKDAGQTLDEMQEMYGVIPSSIDMSVGHTKIQVNRNGLFVIRHVNRETLGILQEVIERVVAEQIRIRNTSEKFNIRTKRLLVDGREVKVSRVVAGKIVLPNAILSVNMVNDMFLPSEEYELGHLNSLDRDEEGNFDFSFVDTSILEKPFIFTATVVDEAKRTIFGISGNENEITIIPKHRVTFESFIGFHNFVVENFDRDAKLKLFSEVING